MCGVCPVQVIDTWCTDGEPTAEVGASGLAGIFHRKKARPSPLPLSNLRTANDPALPPYSPFSAGGAQSPWLGGNFTMQNAQPVKQDIESQVDADNKSIKSMKTVNRAKREAAERAGNPFSPFAPFSPVTAHRTGDEEKGQVGDDTDEESEGEEAIRASSKRNLYKPSSSLHYTMNMPQPSPVRYMDPEAAQAMGIHPDVIKSAKPGISEDEIERRRLRAQRRLEERQRLEEGSVVEDGMAQTSHFSEIASNRRV